MHINLYERHVFKYDDSIIFTSFCLAVSGWLSVDPNFLLPLFFLSSFLFLLFFQSSASLHLCGVYICIFFIKMQGKLYTQVANEFVCTVSSRRIIFKILCKPSTEN